jgi:hypothetical protein
MYSMPFFPQRNDSAHLPQKRTSASRDRAAAFVRDSNVLNLIGESRAKRDCDIFVEYEKKVTRLQ